jgi:hypothetical protein
MTTWEARGVGVVYLSSLRFQGSGFGFRISDFRFQVSGFGFLVAGLGLGFKGQRVEGLRVEG